MFGKKLSIIMSRNNKTGPKKNIFFKKFNFEVMFKNQF